MTDESVDFMCDLATNRVNVMFTRLRLQAAEWEPAPMPANYRPERRRAA